MHRAVLVRPNCRPNLVVRYRRMRTSSVRRAGPQMTRTGPPALLQSSENADRSANAGKNKARGQPHVALNVIKGAEFSSQTTDPYRRSY